MIKRVLNIEDTAMKHVAIVRALNKARIGLIDHAATGDEGLELVEKSIADGKPYDLIITDMHFPIYGEIDPEAGMKVIAELQKREINIPVVVCSSVRYVNIPGAVHCIYYNEKSGNVDDEIREMLNTIQ